VVRGRSALLDLEMSAVTLMMAVTSAAVLMAGALPVGERPAAEMVVAAMSAGSRSAEVTEQLLSVVFVVGRVLIARVELAVRVKVAAARALFAWGA